MIILYIVLTLLLSSFLFIYVCRRERGLNEGRMKRFYIVFTTVLSFFLLLSGREVKADEITLNIPDDVITFTNNNLSIFKDYADSKITNEPIYTGYMITYQPGANVNTRVNIYYFYNNRNISIEPFNSFLQTSAPDSRTILCQYYDDTTLNSCGNAPERRIYFYSPYNPIYYLYSSLNLPPLANNYTYIFSNNDFSYSFVNDGSSSFPSINDLISYWYSGSEDNTPELTSFYTLVLNKIVYFCNYMATNTLFLTMLVIIIIIFIFELIFRRRL